MVYLSELMAGLPAGATIDLPGETLEVDGPVPTRDGQVIRGTPGKTTIRVADSVTDAFNVFAPTSGAFGVEGVRFDLNSANNADVNANTGIAVYLSGAASGWLCDVEVVDGHRAGVRCLGDGTNRLETHDLDVSGCQYGLLASDVPNLRARGGDLSGNTIGLQANRCDDADIDGVTAKNNTSSGVAVLYARGWSLTRCRATDNGTWGIVAGGGSASFTPNREFVVAGNVCRGNTSGGITLDPTVSGSEGDMQDQFATVAHNVCTDHSGANHHGINATHVVGVTFAHNVCRNNGGAGLAIANSSRCTTGGNVLSANGRGLAMFHDGTVAETGYHRVGVDVAYGNTTDDVLEQAGHTDVQYATVA